MRIQVLPRVVILGFLLALAAVSVPAQSGATITATIPFDFTVGGRQLRAGKYTVKPVSEGLWIKNRDLKRTVTRLADRIHTNRASVDTRLVFHRYGELYFLSEVWAAGEPSGRRLVKSRRERAMEKERAHPSKREAQARYESVEIIGSLQ